MPTDALHRRLVRNIRLHAERRRILVSHVPDRAGVSTSTFFGVMGGRVSPTVRWLQKVAHALDCDVVDLFARSHR